MIPTRTATTAAALAVVLCLGAASPAFAQLTQSTESTHDSITHDAGHDDAKSDEKTWKPGKPGGIQGGYWNVLAAYGEINDESLNKMLRFQFGDFTGEKLYSLDVGYTLEDDNALVEFLDPVLSTIEVAVNFTYQDDPQGNIYEIAPYIFARWSQFPWSKYVGTTFGIGDGLSWASQVPQTEYDPGNPDGDYHKILNYIAVEATLSLPEHEDWQLVYRLHHRSGIFGLMGADNDGNTAMQFGIRHYFE